jgi:hypothetical protein
MGDMKRALVLGILAVVLSVLAGSAAGAGPSPGVVYGQPGVASRDGTLRYVAVRAHGGTLVKAVASASGQVRRQRLLRGTFGIPLVAYDGSKGGLSHDGSRLVVYAPDRGIGPPATRFVVLDPRTLRVRIRFALSGNFGFDALSPDGSVMYLIHVKGQGIDYDVRALDLRSGRLLPGVIVDRREPDEKMTGAPMTRAGSDDASWAYTLYSSSYGHPFVHALHTTARQAFCIDIPFAIPDQVLGKVRMRVVGDKLVLRAAGKTIATIDRRTFQVTR